MPNILLHHRCRVPVKLSPFTHNPTLVPRRKENFITIFQERHVDVKR